MTLPIFHTRGVAYPPSIERDRLTRPYRKVGGRYVELDARVLGHIEEENAGTGERAIRYRFADAELRRTFGDGEKEKE